MALGCRVDTVHPIDLSQFGPLPLIVKNVGTPTVYYKRGQNGSSVTPTSKDGEISANGELVVEQQTWVIAKEGGAQLNFFPVVEAHPAVLVNTAGKGFINIQEPPFNAKGDGVHNDGPAINAALVAATEGSVYVPPGLFLTEEAIKIPQQTRLYGQNRYTSTITGTGNINLLDLTGVGGQEIHSLTLASATKQASGSAINFANGFVTGAHIHNLQVGSKFFNGFNIVGKETPAAGVSAVNIHDIHITGETTALKEYGNAAFVIGNTTTARRSINIWLSRIIIQSNSETDVPIGIEMNNADSCHLHTILLQTCGKGLVIGNADASSLRTTNLMVEVVQADGSGTVGFALESCFNSSFSNIRAEATTAGPGVILGEFFSGNTINGSTFYFNTGHGIEANNKMAAVYANTITGNTIMNNGQDKVAGKSGISIADKATGAIGGLIISGNTIGNTGSGLGAEEQKIGITLGKECENVGIYGNHFPKNATSAIKQNGSEKKINNKEGTEGERLTAIEANNQMT